ncbi:MAG: glycosyltransferase family 2 protein [Chitinophagaceae bacterium]
MVGKIIVLTPVKNEAWILEKFLSITSLFADHIIIADQASGDESVALCKKFPKVTVIENIQQTYNEDDRQKLLINTARSMFPDDKRILMALDADEILAADSLQPAYWEVIKQLPEGTTIYFEKPDMLEGMEYCMRWRDNYFALGYVDDGASHHEAKKVHSKRVPSLIPEVRFNEHNIKFMHYAFTRPRAQSAKLRFYSVTENIYQTSRVHLRRKWYKCFFDIDNFVDSSKKERVPAEWTDGWLAKNIDVKNVGDVRISWHDYEVLKHFSHYGEQKFYLDNIWGVDWEYYRQQAIKNGVAGISEKSIKKQPLPHRVAGKIIDTAYDFYHKMRHSGRK